MKKQFLNLGKALNKAEQKSINGGGAIGICDEFGNCPSGSHCEGGYCYSDNTNPNPGGGTGNCTGPWRFCPNGGITCTTC